MMGGNSLVVQWLGLGAFTAEGPGLIPGQGTKIPQVTQHGQKKKKDGKDVKISKYMVTVEEKVSKYFVTKNYDDP